MKFELIGRELENFNKWNREHKKKCECYNTTAIGGRLTFCFTQTSLGTACSVKCACGEEIDVTEYNW